MTRNRFTEEYFIFVVVAVVVVANGVTNAQNILNCDDPHFYFEKGSELSQKMGKHEEAVALLTQAILCRNDESGKHTEFLVESYYNRAIAYYHLGRLGLALADFTAALKIKPRYASALYNRGNVYYGLRQYAMAIEDYTNAININKYYPEAYVGRAYVLLENHNYDSALDDCNKAIDLKPDYNDAVNTLKIAIDLKNKSLLTRYNKRTDNATRSNVSEDVALNHFRSGQRYQLAGNYNSAIGEYDKSLGLKPRSIVYLYRGIAKAEMKSILEAIQTYIKMRSNSSYSRVRNTIADSIEDYNAAVDTNPEYDVAILVRALAHHSVYHRLSALDDYNIVLALGASEVEPWGINTDTIIALKREIWRSCADQQYLDRIEANTVYSSSGYLLPWQVERINRENTRINSAAELCSDHFDGPNNKWLEGVYHIEMIVKNKKSTIAKLNVQPSEKSDDSLFAIFEGEKGFYMSKFQIRRGRVVNFSISKKDSPVRLEFSGKHYGGDFMEGLLRIHGEEVIKMNGHEIAKINGAAMTWVARRIWDNPKSVTDLTAPMTPLKSTDANRKPAATKAKRINRPN
jgi:tetratricopeptide (TPR) repeat protein